MLIKALVAVLLAAASCTAQTKSATPNDSRSVAAGNKRIADAEAKRKAMEQTVKITTGYVLIPSIVISDLGCAKDYFKALSADGIARRKMLSDLETYGCIRVFKSALVYNVVSSDRQVIAAPNGTGILWRVKGPCCGWNTNVTLLGSGDGVDMEWKRAIEFHETVLDGWILDEDFQRVTEDEMVARALTVRKAALAKSQ